MSEAELAKYFITKKIPYVKPLYSIDYTKESAVCDWFQNAETNLNEYYRPLFREQKENLAFFVAAGINPMFATPYAATFATTSDVYAEPQQIFINEMYRVTMAQVSLIVSNEMVADVLPNNADYEDRVAANIVSDWLASMDYDLDMSTWRFRWQLQKKIFGESFGIPMWNPNIGDLHPMAKRFIDEDLGLVDENDEPIMDETGSPRKIRKDTRIGDIEIINPMPWEIHIDPKEHYKDAMWFYWKEQIDLEYLKKKYPRLQWEDRKNTDSSKYYDPYTNSEKDDYNRRTIYYLFHKSTEFLPEGRFIIASRTHVLVNEPLSMPTIINNQDLPLVRFIDLDIGFGVRGIPILFRNCKNLTDAENRISNQIYNNLEMESPKLFVHESAGVDAQRMPNGTIVVEWKGNVKPTVETPQTNTASIFNFRDSIKKSLDELALQTPMVRGDTPNAQLDSFVALQHFEDLRNQLAAPDLKGEIKSMEQWYRLMITIARDKYKPDDGRLIKILGKHNTYQLRFFDPINLQKSYDVKISTTGNLANSKAARTQMVINIKREFPQIISDEIFVDALGLSHTKKFMNVITTSVSSAEEENYEMLSGNPVLPPARYEDLIVHWETHRIPMQTLDFKHAPDEVKSLLIGHVAATEKLMFEQAAENPVFAQKIETLRQFPMIYTPRPVNEATPELGGEELPPEGEGLLPPEDQGVQLPGAPTAIAEEEVVAEAI